MSSRTVLWSLRLGRYSGKIVGKKNFWKRVMEKKMTYEEALQRLQKLVELIEAPDAAIAGVEKELKEAMELLEFCKGELDGYEKKFDNILNKE